MADKGGVSGTGVFVAVVGSILVWSGVKDKKISAIVQDLIAGNNPVTSPSGLNLQDQQYLQNLLVPPTQGGTPPGSIGGGPTGPVPRGSLSESQIYNYAKQAGFDTVSAIVITAISMAESGGRPTARCHNCFPGVTEDSRGLTQINVDAHPQYAGVNLYDPLTNLQAAHAVSGGGVSFTPWSTFTSGAYLRYMAAARRAAGLG